MKKDKQLKEIFEIYGDVCCRYGIIKGCDDEVRQVLKLFKKKKKKKNA